MAKTLSLVLLLALGGCSGLGTHRPSQSACAAGEATYACQIERYHNVSA